MEVRPGPAALTRGAALTATNPRPRGKESLSRPACTDSPTLGQNRHLWRWKGLWVSSGKPWGHLQTFRQSATSEPPS